MTANDLNAEHKVVFRLSSVQYRRHFNRTICCITKPKKLFIFKSLEMLLSVKKLATLYEAPFWCVSHNIYRYSQSHTQRCCIVVFKTLGTVRPVYRDRRFATLQKTLFMYLINKYISLSDICLKVDH